MSNYFEEDFIPPNAEQKFTCCFTWDTDNGCIDEFDVMLNNKDELTDINLEGLWVVSGDYVDYDGKPLVVKLEDWLREQCNDFGINHYASEEHYERDDYIEQHRLTGKQLGLK